MATQFQNLALLATETEGKAFTLHSGYYLFAAGLPTGQTFPTSIKLQMRFKDQTGNYVPWFDTGTVLADTERTDIVFASPLVEYRLLASAAGAIVHYSEVKIGGS